jgi:uncharacterized protein YndB with AHSA1/START domain
MKEVRNTIELTCSKERIWEILTQSAYTRIYMFGCDAISDWQVGSSLIWQGKHEGNEMVFVTGSILEIDRPNLLVYSVIDPHASYPSTMENHLKVRYEIEEMGTGCRLTVTQYGFEMAAEGEKRFEEVNNKGLGWQPILDVMKGIADGVG